MWILIEYFIQLVQMTVWGWLSFLCFGNHLFCCLFNQLPPVGAVLITMFICWFFI